MSTKSKDENMFKGVDGTIFGLFPESSKSLYQECVVSWAKNQPDPKIRVASTLDLNDPLTVSTTQRIQEAEVVIADVTGHDLAVIWELGVACGLKEANKIIVLQSRRDDSYPQVDFPLDLSSFTVRDYDPDDLSQLRTDLAITLNESLRNPPPVEPIEDPYLRQTVDKAVKLTHAGDWDLARMVFEKADRKLKDHWYIHMQWGVMHREEGKYDEALEHLKKAEGQARFSEHQAQVLIERAILAFHKQEASEVERLFAKAKNTHKKNRRLYTVWADIYDRLGLHARALGQILDLMEEVGSDPEAQLLTRYYTAKINNPNAKLNLAEFERNEKAKADNRPPNPQPQPPKGKPQTPNKLKAARVPRTISWSKFRHRFQGRTVFGTVKDWHPKHGVFIYVGRFKGRLPVKWARPDFKTWYTNGKEVKVTIKRCHMLSDGLLAVDLRESS